MALVEFDVPDAPGCPLLGLAVDRRTRQTFPHPSHRCYASGSPRWIEPGHQSTYCLSVRYSTCDRYVAWQRRADDGEQQRPPQESREVLARLADPPSVATIGVADSVHIVIPPAPLAASVPGQERRRRRAAGPS